MKTINELITKSFINGKVVIPTLEKCQQINMSEADLKLFFETYKNEILNAVFSKGLDYLARDKNIFVAMASPKEKSFTVIANENDKPYRERSKLVFVSDDSKLKTKLDIYSVKFKEYRQNHHYHHSDAKTPIDIFNSIEL